VTALFEFVGKNAKPRDFQVAFVAGVYRANKTDFHKNFLGGYSVVSRIVNVFLGEE
jgi:hypothetical protein